MSAQWQLLVVITTSTHPFSVTSERIPFAYKERAESAKTKIERQFNGFGTGVNVEVVLLEGASD